MKAERTALLKSQNQLKIDIQKYKDFLRGETQTFEGRYGAEEYIKMSESRLKDINHKLERMDKEIK